MVRSMLLFSLIFLIGCSSHWSGKKGSGVVTTQSREIEAFEKLEFAGAGNIDLVVGGETHLEVVADDNLLEDIVTEVVDGVLKINFKESLAPSQTIQFKIITDQLNSLQIAGSSRSVITGIESENFDISIAGSADIECSGIAEKTTIDIAGAGSIKALDLTSRYAKLSISGSGSVEINAVDELGVSIAGSGKVRYTGSPTISQSIAGVGSVKAKENEED